MKALELYEAHASQHTSAAVSSARDVQIAHWVRDRLASTFEPSIVEIGSADGELSRLIAGAVPAANVTGLDIAATRVQRANERATRAGLAPRLRYEQCDLDAAGISRVASDSVDAVVMIDVLEHVFDVFAAVREIARVTRVGGVVLLRVPNIAYVKRRLELLRGQLPVTASWFGPAGDLAAWRDAWGWDGGHIHYFTRNTLSLLLRDAGLSPIEWRDPGARYEGTRRYLPDLLLGNLGVCARRVG